MAVAKNTQLQVRIPVALHRQLAKLADESGRTSSEIVRHLITSEIDKTVESVVDERMDSVSKLVKRTGHRVEDLFAVVRSIDQDQARRERQRWDDFILQFEARLSTLESAIQGLGERLTGSSLLTLALLDGAQNPGPRRSFVRISRGLREGKTLEDFASQMVSEMVKRGE